MLKKLFWAVSVTAMAFGQAPHAFGQSPGELGPPNTPPKLSKWELALDALPLIDKESDPFGFLLRKYVGDSARKAIRFKLHSSFARLANAPSNEFSLGASLGAEWLRSYGKTVVYPGIEADLTYSRSDSPRAGGVMTRWNWQPGVNLLVGGRYQFHPHWAISVESVIRYSVTINHDNLPVSETTYRATYHRLNVIPIRAIYLSYRL